MARAAALDDADVLEWASSVLGFVARSLEEVREPRHLGRLTASVLPDDGVSHPQLVASDPERAALAVRSAADRLGLDPRLPPFAVGLVERASDLADLEAVRRHLRALCVLASLRHQEAFRVGSLRVALRRRQAILRDLARPNPPLLVPDETHFASALRLVPAPMRLQTYAEYAACYTGCLDGVDRAGMARLWTHVRFWLALDQARESRSVAPDSEASPPPSLPSRFWKQSWPACRRRLLRGLARHGVPALWRGEFWMRSTGAESLLRHSWAQPGRVTYRAVLARLGMALHASEGEEGATPDSPSAARTPWSQVESGFQVLQDVRRTVRNLNPLGLLHVPAELLRASKDQGLNFIAAHILRWVGEEEAFWLLVRVCGNGGRRSSVSTSREAGTATAHTFHALRDPPQSFGTEHLSSAPALPSWLPAWYYIGMDGPEAERRTLADLIRCHLPRLDRHLSEKLNFPLDLALAPTLQWFVCLFTAPFSPRVAARLWDRFVVDGPKTFHRTALALLRWVAADLVRPSVGVGDVVQTVESVGDLLDPAILTHPLHPSRTSPSDALSPGTTSGEDAAAPNSRAAPSTLPTPVALMYACCANARLSEHHTCFVLALESNDEPSFHLVASNPDVDPAAEAPLAASAGLTEPAVAAWIRALCSTGLVSLASFLEAGSESEESRAPLNTAVASATATPSTVTAAAAAADAAATAASAVDSVSSPFSAASATKTLGMLGARVRAHDVAHRRVQAFFDGALVPWAAAGPSLAWATGVTRQLHVHVMDVIVRHSGLPGGLLPMGARLSSGSVGSISRNASRSSLHGSNPDLSTLARDRRPSRERKSVSGQAPTLKLAPIHSSSANGAAGAAGGSSDGEGGGDRSGGVGGEVGSTTPASAPTTTSVPGSAQSISGGTGNEVTLVANERVSVGRAILNFLNPFHRGGKALPAAASTASSVALASSTSTTPTAAGTPPPKEGRGGGSDAREGVRADASSTSTAAQEVGRPAESRERSELAPAEASRQRGSPPTSRSLSLNPRAPPLSPSTSTAEAGRRTPLASPHTVTGTQDPSCPAFDDHLWDAWGPTFGDTADGVPLAWAPTLRQHQMALRPPVAGAPSGGVDVTFLDDRAGAAASLVAPTLTLSSTSTSTSASPPGKHHNHLGGHHPHHHAHRHGATSQPHHPHPHASRGSVFQSHATGSPGLFRGVRSPEPASLDQFLWDPWRTHGDPTTDDVMVEADFMARREPFAQGVGEHRFWAAARRPFESSRIHRYLIPSVRPPRGKERELASPLTGPADASLPLELVDEVLSDLVHPNSVAALRRVLLDQNLWRVQPRLRTHEDGATLERPLTTSIASPSSASPSASSSVSSWSPDGIDWSVAQALLSLPMLAAAPGMVDQERVFVTRGVVDFRRMAHVWEERREAFLRRERERELDAADGHSHAGSAPTPRLPGPGEAMFPPLRPLPDSIFPPTVDGPVDEARLVEVSSRSASTAHVRDESTRDGVGDRAPSDADVHEDDLDVLEATGLTLESEADERLETGSTRSAVDRAPERRRSSRSSHVGELDGSTPVGTPAAASRRGSLACESSPSLRQWSGWYRHFGADSTPENASTDPVAVVEEALVHPVSAARRARALPILPPLSGYRPSAGAASLGIPRDADRPRPNLSLAQFDRLDPFHVAGDMLAALPTRTWPGHRLGETPRGDWSLGVIHWSLAPPCDPENEDQWRACVAHAAERPLASLDGDRADEFVRAEEPRHGAPHRFSSVESDSSFEEVPKASSVTASPALGAHIIASVNLIHDYFSQWS